MPCTGAVSSTCTGILTGEACGPAKTVIPGIPALDGLNFQSDGTSLTVSWATDISYPTQFVRGQLREADGIGYALAGFQLAVRNDGSFVFLELTPDTEYRVWLRVEDDTNATQWITLRVTTTPGLDVDINFILHDGEVVVHRGELVIF